ncbi:MAG: hypothetical protein CML05_08025 [Pseudozobellia sp.]|nr:hypothetical protein [Pseudozobellia sp.]|tara:strand:+ start:3405 stop:4211 length:807 start_codon:yes stop_codon:yes gene_type:complete
MVNSLYEGFYRTKPLWLNEQFGIEQFHFPEVTLQPPFTETIPAKMRLGHQMEFVFKDLIERSGAYEILLYNQPILSGKQTIGEIDFILGNKETIQQIHVELTYKFYVIDSSISEPIHRLMGPNRRDMFFTKMEKIKNRQFQLLHSEEGKKVLFSKNIDPNRIHHLCCFKAQLFHHYLEEQSHIRPLNKACLSGFWIRFKDFESSVFRGYHYYMPKKWQWVIRPHETVEWMSHFETLMEVNLRMINENSPMLWLKKNDGTIQKLFVVWW